MYHFIDLTEEQKGARRDRLDWYAVVAATGVFVPLLWMQVFALARWLRRKWTNSHDAATAVPPSSPYVKQSRLERPFSAAAAWRQFAWWCGEEVQVAGWLLGRRGEVLGAGAWTGWLVVLCFLDTGDDYLHLTKRFGIVGASQLPWHYLLSMKSPRSPLQGLTGRSHECLIALHQLLGRVITFLLYCHALLYLNFYVQKQLLAEKLSQGYVLCGIFGIIAFTTVGTTALKPLRDRSYRVFYITHVVLATALLPVLWFHVRYIRLYLYETSAVYAVNLLLRFIATKTHIGSIRPVPGTGLIEIDIPLTSAPGRRGKLSSYQPGQHAYISLPGHPLSRTFRSNPFTVASIPATDARLKFVARVRDGNTAKLAHSPSSMQSLSIEGPYGLATHSDALLRYDRVLFVAGGVGATFIMPLYRQLLADLSPSKGSQRRQRVSFVWVARSMADVRWALPEDGRERDGLVERLHVYLTRDAESVSAGGMVDDFTIGEEDEGQAALAGGDEGIELEERRTLLTADGVGEKSPTALSVRAGRPDVGRVVEQVFAHGDTERVAVMVCGPKTLSRSLRREVGRWVGRGRDVWFWDEAFNT